jgi:hypothetical protein
MSDAGHDSNFQFTTNAMVNDGTKVKASSRLVKDEESKVHSSKRAKCGCQKETFMVNMENNLKNAIMFINFNT